MSKYLKLFETVSQYNAYTADTANFIKPNVSLITETNTVAYNPYVEPIETMVVAKYNVTTDTKTQMILGYRQTGGSSSAVTTAFTSVYVDGNEIEISAANVNYTFDTVGEHTVKYELKDPTKINSSAFNGSFNGPSIGVKAVSITIPDSVTTIGNNAFEACTSLTSIDIPNSVTSIGVSVFTYCSGLTSITIPSGVTSISNNIFSGCTSLTSIDIPSGVTSIGSSAFTYCSGLTSITIPSGVTTIGGVAFSGCSSLTNINIPSGVTSIGEGAFGGTPWWGTYSADTSHHYGNIIYINDIAYQATSTSITSATFKSETVSISNSAFKNCTGLTSIDIPSGVTSISNSAFRGCTSLTSIDIPDSVTSIGGSAFSGCTSLTSIDIPDSVTSIGNSAFYNCSRLTSCTIGSGVASIESNVFRYCSGLTSIVSNAATAPTINSYTFYDVNTGGTLTVPSGSSGYDVWMGTGNYYLGKYNWTKVEQ